MRHRVTWGGAMILAVGLMGIGQPVRALVTRNYPLSLAMTAKLVFMAQVDKLYPDKPGVVLKVGDQLRGKAPFDKLAIALAGDSDARKGKHTEQLLKRLAPGLPLVVFVNPHDRGYSAFAYTNGTWFQMIGHVEKGDQAKVRWQLTHCEPYMRRTFKGPTAELRRVVTLGLAGKQKPPEPDPKEPPGLGPEVKPSEKARGSRIEDRGSTEHNGRSSILDRRSAKLHRGPFFAVIPTVGIFGPLAILAMLFPAVFGGLALWLRRWWVLLSVASMDSTLYLLYAWFGGRISQHGWGSPAALWLLLSLVTLAGAVWSWHRHRAAVRAGQAEVLQPRRSDALALGSLSVIGLAVVGFCIVKETLFMSPWKELLPVWIVVWVGGLAMLLWRWRTGRQPGPRTALPAEGIMLLGLVFACAGLGATIPAPDSAAAFETPGPAPTRRQRVVWRFQPKEPGLIVSSPVVAGERVYAAALHQDFQPYGSVYCLDRATGNEIWRFNDDKNMKPVFCSPCVADGRLYIGEGFHQDSGCKLYCLDPNNGAKIWEFATTSHTESTPCVAGGRVFFGAGDDGVYCLDARTGAKVWHFEGLHVDTQLAMSGNRLYGGSGYGTFETFCLDTATGKPVWQTPTRLPVFGSPAVAGLDVFVGTGNGDFSGSAEHPAGALVCLDARTGKPRWPGCKVADGVHVRPAVDGERIYFCSRDHHCYCADRNTGKVRWKHDVGSPAVASPALAGDSVYAIASAGRVCCLDADSGHLHWNVDVAKLANVGVTLRSSPMVTTSRDGQAERHRIYFGAELNSLIGSAALYCLEDEVDNP